MLSAADTWFLFRNFERPALVRCTVFVPPVNFAREAVRNRKGPGGQEGQIVEMHEL